ncbi:MAG TPA: acetyl-CoA carboxylase carboxyltransferase subunit alpha [Candidatus Polarisedimenticolia bacterium]|nr:acetyl-CoA carboxylase carboxyltransferase subunit alpha [Candidatus Polarisedimenticolia bacterium]
MSRQEESLEQPILEIEKRIDELTGVPGGEDRTPEIERLKRQLQDLRGEIYSHLTAWQKALVARHPKRPYTLDYIQMLFNGLVEIHGDRKFADDPAIVGGFATYQGMPVAVVGHQKGRDIREKIRRNFGMPSPDGYRKALRIMKLAEKFRRPVFCFIDTPGAYPGKGAEERGQAEAIAVNLREMSRLRVPVLVTVTGEGGSGGALAIGVGDRVNMLEHSIYSVISPEGCAAILWSDAGKAQEAAKAMRITATDLKELGIVDQVVPEPVGGAHADPKRSAELLDAVLSAQLEELVRMDPARRLESRYEKFRKLGRFGQSKFL